MPFATKQYTGRDGASGAGCDDDSLITASGSGVGTTNLYLLISPLIREYGVFVVVK